ncbi:MAG: OmpA family protein [Betaproteobacteria bacterium]|nr:OmpA family protein [Betaproteobacteria bacterium]
MRVALASAIIMMMMAGCAQFGSQPHADSQPVRWTNSQQPIEPEALRPSDRPARNDLIVLLPKPNGTIGGVIVRTEGGGELLLNKAYAGAHIEGPGMMQPVTYDADRAKREFSSVIAALPGRPATFLLYFLEGKDELTPDSEREVERVFAEIAARPYPEVSVIGHTDAVGNTQFNDQLSQQRAQRVHDDLAKRGISADRIEVSGRGKREPLVPTSEGVSEPKNRRVEINVR